MSIAHWQGMRVFSLWVLTCLAVVTSGCTTTLHMRDGSHIAGHVSGASESHVHIVLADSETPEESLVRSRHAQPRLGREGLRPGGRLHRVRKDSIDDVSLPGTGVAIAGAVIAAIGTSFVIWGVAEFTDCGGDLCGLGHLFTTIPGAFVASAGIAMLIPGLVIYSNEAADMERPVPAELAVSPSGLRLTW